MRSLAFKKLWILSKAEKAAVGLTFDRGVNLLTGENDVGKSTLMKSLYHCLGADTPQINNTIWKRSHPVYCVLFEVHGVEYYVVRDEKYFGVFDGNKVLISRHVGVTGKNGFSLFINKILGFDIELERQADGKLGVAGPSFYFLPFYIDQDEGWGTSWSSFVGLQQFSSYRRLMIDYHLGVRPQSYYDARKREIELQERLSVLEAERVSMQAARDSVQKRKDRSQIDLDPAAFRAELENVVDQYNVVYAEQQTVLSRLKDVRNQRNAIDTELNLLRKSISELEADYRFTESPDTPDVVGCPTCGTEFCNSFVERFGILDDIDHCRALIDQWLKKRNEISVRLEGIEAEYKAASARHDDVQTALARTKENVTLAELIASEGMKEMISSLNSDINEVVGREHEITEKLRENAPALKVDSTRKNSIVTWYKARMKEYLNSLNVGVLSESDYGALDKQIKNNALGSDLPRALLAQYFAFLSTMNSFGSFVLAPMLIDSPFQQEQDATNRQAILDFILSKRLPGQQLILATISVAEFERSDDLASATECKLDHKLSLLRPELYQSVFSEVGGMHEMTLAEAS